MSKYSVEVVFKIRVNVSKSADTIEEAKQLAFEHARKQVEALEVLESSITYEYITT
jgi:hypothetical protein